MVENSSEGTGTGKKSGQAWVWIILFLVVVAVGGGLVYMTKSDEPEPDKTAAGQPATGQLDQQKAEKPQDGTQSQAAAKADAKAGPAKVMDLTADKKSKTETEAKTGTKTETETGTKADKKAASTGGADSTTGPDDQTAKQAGDQAGDSTGQVKIEETDTPVDAKSAARKAKLGLKDSVQGVVAEDESNKVGGKVIPMDRIAAKIRSRKRQVKEENLGGTGEKTDQGSAEASAEAADGAAVSTRTDSESTTASVTAPKGVDMEVKPKLKFGGGKKISGDDPGETEQAPTETVKIVTGADDKSQQGQSEKEKAAVKAALEAVKKAQARERDQGQSTAKASAQAGAQAKTQAGSDVKTQPAVKQQPETGRKLEQKITAKAKKPLPRLYGVRVAQAGDNLWKIHFLVLKEYFGHRGIEVSGNADNPDTTGHSTGVGRILKYAERMAYIYSAREDKLLDDLDYILPEDLIIVFDMTRLNNILSLLDAEKIKKVRFDGTNLYLEG